MHLYQVLAQRVAAWRQQGYHHADYPAIAEILAWAANPEGAGFRLRPPQVRALETYWYLRLVESTPHITDLYRRLFPKPSELLAALGLAGEEVIKHFMDYGLDGLFERLKSDDAFVRRLRLEALRESLTLSYPSYILALAMGAGKTILIGAIFASEFAMALEYPEGPFVQNALVFAPGKTIIESLRELAAARYDRILPPRLYKPFAASVKLTFTRDGDPDIPVIRGSFFNVVVTNTEKVRIRKESIRRADLGPLFSRAKEDEARAEVANRRLQAIASLPHLAIFSDEAHHTYGQSLDAGLKKVRRTVDYLAANTSLIAVVNTTGTPYYQRQPLRDVVIWYGLSEGIGDGILKEVAGNIQAFSFDGKVEAYLAHVVRDFFQDYGGVALPDGNPARLAIYFPQTDDVEALRPVIEATLAELGLPPTLILEHHTRRENKADFDRFRFKDSPHRIALLVDRGVEGWDVPALFACALARKLKASNNFVLQAASRCLRQVPGNTTPARIYLSLDNREILDRQLQETYGETISDLNRSQAQSRTVPIRLRRLDIPPLVVRRLVRTVVPREAAPGALQLSKPEVEAGAALERRTYTVAEQKATCRLLQQVGETVEIDSVPDMVDAYAAALELATVYRLRLDAVLAELRRLYGGAAELPAAHLAALARQVEAQTRRYEVREETVEEALALVKPEGFTRTLAEDGSEVYTAEIAYPVDRQRLLLSWEELRAANPHGLGFHYTPYNFDSNPEKSLFEQLLRQFNLHPDDVEDIYFTGALTTPDKTDFFVEYRGDDGRWHRYTPDFVIRCKDGRALIVEIKNAQFEAATREDLRRAQQGQAAITVEGRKALALKQWEALNADRLRYELVFAREDTVGYDQLRPIRRFVEWRADDEAGPVHE
ncbi:MAG TPA: DEAD/DEAH box helicase family protein [Anaerolineae bacterium]|nr:DEAD/DEAH box helicase family protein [Anaerolineae bacterium]HOQ97588.1 DEAD/DEAH box helicase family protein [Anaerolineae bacterium]HPL28907.1 DEAD/DEAH box helicase family protein [Anaerolineae bacterium]